MSVSTMLAIQLRRRANRCPEPVIACIGLSPSGRTPGPVAFDSVAEHALLHFTGVHSTASMGSGLELLEGVDLGLGLGGNLL